MTKFTYGALALAALSASAQAADTGWSGLDQEINNLSTSLSAQNAAGPKIGGFLKTSFRYSDDQDALFGGPPNDEDELGFKIDKVRVEISGDLGQDYSYKISFEGSSGTVETRDAYVSWKMAESVKGTMGQFKKPFLRSSLISDQNLLFYERTAVGDFFDVREPGMMFNGNFDTIEWWLARWRKTGKEEQWRGSRF